MVKLSALKKFFVDRIVLIIIISYAIAFTILTLPWFVTFNLSFELSFLIAILSFSVHRLIDYKSTIKVIKEFDKDFWKYKLDRFYRELSPTLSRQPSEKDVKSFKILIINIVVFAILFGLPFLWYHSYQLGTALCFSFSLTAPIVYLNNSLMTNNIRISKMIAKGKKINEKFRKKIKYASLSIY